jgi:peptidoglycan hydrolase CwlO-like protein
MGLLDFLLTDNSVAVKKVLSTQQAKIVELEDTIKRLTDEVHEFKEKFSELANLVSYIAQAQQQMASDMSIIYENIQAVAEALKIEAQDSDDKYFTWRWNHDDDDDDLPN